MTQRSATHTNFVIERDFPAPPTRVFSAWSDADARLIWSDCHTDARESEFSMDFRHGGHETYRVRLPDGLLIAVEKVFFDIVQDQRIIFGYDIVIGERRASASLVTVSFELSRMIHSTAKVAIATPLAPPQLTARIAPPAATRASS